jgi:hypothetical protein
MLDEPNRDLAREIANLEVLNLDNLRLRWQAVFGRVAPSHLSRQFLLHLFAYRLQADMNGDLSSSTLQLLGRLGRAKPIDGKVLPLPTKMGGQDRLKPGTVLVREHDGVSHRVMVVSNGFGWNGGTYSNLSQVAKAITGTNWNGPRFFGLRDHKASA